MKNIHLIFIVLCLMLSFSGCKKKDQPVKVAKPEITQEQTENAKNVNLNILRYEQALFSVDQNNLAAGIAALYGKYPENLIQKGAWNNQDMMGFLLAYLNDKTILQLYKDSQDQFSDMSEFKKQITPALESYLLHFPGESVPEFCTLISGMDFDMPSVFGYENTIFICLDMYLGSNYKQYAQAGMPKYIAARCDKKYMATDCFSKALVYRHLPDNTLVTLLDNMIDAGKKMMFTQTMFPNTPTRDILQYDEAQYKWAQTHESAVWHHFIEKNLLYDKSDDVTRRMIDETPFTRDFGNSSPGRIGYYIGYQIVKRYMESHPQTTLKELMKMTDSQKLLKESGYKPK